MEKKPHCKIEINPQLQKNLNTNLFKKKKYCIPYTFYFIF